MSISDLRLPAVALIASLPLLACAEDSPDVPPAADAMEAEVETEAGVDVPAFDEEVRTAFRAWDDTTRAMGTLRLLVPVEPVDPQEPPRIHVQLEGLAPGEHAWHVFEGPCTVEGGMEIPLSPVSGFEGLTAPLQVSDDGTAEAEVAVPPLNELWVEAGNYSVRVYEGSGAEPGELAACANL